MEAPDKIYLLSTPYRFLSFWYDYESPAPDNFKQTEYIRKDVADETIETAEDHAYFAGKEKMREELLEWAKEQEKKLESGSFTSLGKRKMLERIVEKIESL